MQTFLTRTNLSVFCARPPMPVFKMHFESFDCSYSSRRPIAIAIKWNWKLILSVDTVLLILLLNVRKQTHFIYCSPENRKCLYSNNKYFQSCLRAGDAGQQYHGENTTDYVSAHSNSYFSPPATGYHCSSLIYDIWIIFWRLDIIESNWWYFQSPGLVYPQCNEVPDWHLQRCSQRGWIQLQIVEKDSYWIEQCISYFQGYAVHVCKSKYFCDSNNMIQARRK